MSGYLAAILIVVAVGIWSYFAFSLGPSLWSTDRFAFSWWMLAAVIYGWLTLQFLYSGWLGQEENSTGVQAVAAAAQAVFAVALIVLTIRTVQANAKLVEETEKMAAVAVQQQQAAIRPVLAFRIYAHEGHPYPHARLFIIQVVNMGVGPALDSQIELESPFRFTQTSDYVQPLAIAPTDDPHFTFALDEDDPLLNSGDPLRWPRTPEEAALIKERDELELKPIATIKGSPERERLQVVRDDVWTRRHQHLTNVVKRIRSQNGVGQIRATYRDLGGAVHESVVDLLVSKPNPVGASSSGEGEIVTEHNWKSTGGGLRFALGSLSVKSRVTSEAQGKGATESAP